MKLQHEGTQTQSSVLWFWRVAMSTLTVFGLAVCPFGVEAETREDTSVVRPNMDLVFRAYVDIQRFTFDEKRFASDENEGKIGDLLSTLSGNFHSVESVSNRYLKEPGFVATLKEVNDMLQDTSNRFKEGKKSYALWRIRNVSDYCVSCHTRYSVEADFPGSDPDSSEMTPYDRGEFYLATRQFSKAKPEFLKAVETPALLDRRIDAFRQWLLIQVRVNPDPQDAMRTIGTVKNKVNFSPPELDEIQGWLVSLRRWQNERKINIDPVTKAEVLIQQGLNLNANPSSRSGSVEFLRATSILHRFLEEHSAANDAKRSRALLLLGEAYHNLQPLFVRELAERFFEECIRKYPGTPDARRAYKELYEIVTDGYTGSGGTQIPDEVQLQLRELDHQARGIPESLGTM